MAAALKFAKYDYKFEFGAGAHNGKQRRGHSAGVAEWAVAGLSALRVRTRTQIKAARAFGHGPGFSKKFEPCGRSPCLMLSSQADFMGCIRRYTARNALAAAATVLAMSSGVCATERNRLELRGRQINPFGQHAVEKFRKPGPVAFHRVSQIADRIAGEVGAE